MKYIDDPFHAFIQVSMVLDESKKLWQKEHDAEMVANNSSNEISQSVLKEVIFHLPITLITNSKLRYFMLRKFGKKRSNDGLEI